MTLMKVIGNEITSLKIISAKAETTEIMLRTVSKRKMALIKVIGIKNTSLKIISAKTETIENKLRTGSKYEMALIKVVQCTHNTFIALILCFETVLSLISVVTVFAEMIFNLFFHSQ